MFLISLNKCSFIGILCKAAGASPDLVQGLDPVGIHPGAHLVRDGLHRTGVCKVGCAHLDSGSAWTLTGTCYITGLTLADGAVLKAAGGKRLSMTVDGVETPVQSGAYIGKIALSVS